MRLGWLIGAALFGVAALSVYVAFNNPDFVAGLMGVMIVAGYKAIVPTLSKRMTPELEDAFHQCVRRGGEWDSIRKRCK